MEDINNDVQTNENVEGGQEEIQGTNYTEAQINDMLQRSGDKRVSDALNKQSAKNSESNKLKAMDETQRQTYEYEERVKAMDLRESDFNLMSNKVEAQKVLATRGLPVEFSDYIVNESADTMMANIDVFDKQFKSAVSDAVSKKISSPAPKQGNTVQGGMTKEKFSKLSIPEQSNLYRNNPTLYKELSKK
jgi:hypothetical protein